MSGTDTNPTLSVLLSYYHGTRAADLQAALESLAQQTRPADQIVIVEDGPSPAELRKIAASYADELVILPENQGLGAALAKGADAVTSTWLARLDSDDLASPERFATQLEFLATHPEVDVLGTAVGEFDDATYLTTGSLEKAAGKIRRLPTTHPEIGQYLKINSPVNHPSVMLRLSELERVGGYQPLHHMEDYYLWARLYAAGAKFYNLPQALTWFRTSQAQVARRQRGMFQAERQMQRKLVGLGIVSRPRAIGNLLLRSIYRMLPEKLLQRVYTLLFHRTR
ncbi:glycosyltransferase [Corynebacterium caspium]|uniref:glycosyltransferase n=1 Tax=Corynebacterium caspium TaxID=234828 RepID=UPI00037AA294|nr:glycosyltransferase [Corynebacterium caspium]WKD59941.1 UDP-Gal:alpha-D-GlcNAc-diphosphoundecaprenol beta-1,3-galactosyltransferase [Corynebacterium caspium DSM 44850]